ncbi:MAG: hypothetical protein RR400_04390 [Clostridia bacterium]
MKEFFNKLSLYVSAFIPLYFLVIIKLIVEIINENLSFNVLNTLMLIVNLMLILIGVIGFVKTIKTKSNSCKIKIIKHQNLTDQHFLGYFSLFVLFAISFELEKVSMAFVYIIVLIFVGIVYLKNNLYYINPFLNILGYSFHEITFVVENEKIQKTAMIFFKGAQLDSNRIYEVNLKNENFGFVYDKKEKIN